MTTGIINSPIVELIRDTARQVMPADSRVVLFGSQARGDAGTDSDWDLLLLLNKKNSWKSAFDDYAFPFVELGWANGKEINPIVYTFDEWANRRNTPFYQNVERDGINIQ